MRLVLAKLKRKVDERNEKVAVSKRCDPKAGLRDLEPWVTGHKLSTFVKLSLKGRTIEMTIDESKKDRKMLLAGCSVIVTDVPKSQLDAQSVHDRYMYLEKVEQDFRFLKTGFLEVRPIFVRKDEQTRGHVFVCLLALKLSREMQARLTYNLKLRERSVGELGNEFKSTCPFPVGFVFAFSWKQKQNHRTRKTNLLNL